MVARFRSSKVANHINLMTSGLGLGLDKLDSSHVECVCVVVGTGNGRIGKWTYHVACRWLGGCTILRLDYSN